LSGYNLHEINQLKFYPVNQSVISNRRFDPLFGPITLVFDQKTIVFDQNTTAFFARYERRHGWILVLALLEIGSQELAQN
jgi:hypothetical protein